MTLNLNGALSKEYVGLWRSCVIRPSRVAEVDAIVNRMVAHKDRYTKAGKPHGVPWQVFYGVSNNTRAFWSILNARRVIGYDPQDDSEVRFAADIRRLLADSPGRTQAS